MIIKILLLAVVFALAVSALRIKKEVHSGAIKKIGFILLLFGGILAILEPDLVTYVANAVGVGRGTDLVFYIFAVAFLFQIINSYEGHKRNDEKITELVRKIALMEACEHYKKKDTQLNTVDNNSN
ncbi:MAG: DUF2304 domain-containing protein [Candidatus Ancillula sp.]|jgi:hypothetical protein|nr:DUF2304 domain-containing protein [Candidatus Ancillula sp.]